MVNAAKTKRWKGRGLYDGSIKLIPEPLINFNITQSAVTTGIVALGATS